MNGELPLTAKERLENFLTGIDKYIDGCYVSKLEYNENFVEAETLNLDDLGSLGRDACFDYAFCLYQYADHISRQIAKTKNIIMWCEQSINQMFVSELDILSQEYVKHDIKMALFLKRNDLAQKITSWKMSAQGRLNLLQGKEVDTRRKADCLIEKGKRK